MLEFSPVRDSSGNGLAEKGVQTIEGMVRTHLLDLDEKLKCKLPLDGPGLHGWWNSVLTCTTGTRLERMEGLHGRD